ncbi:hypothetical protein EDC01DRAFT_785351 [Geopyxis carbonaria]|nr:hypothetical protein EDC01DRAFT_785351 [Geopyxis carbonaria]
MSRNPRSRPRAPSRSDSPSCCTCPDNCCRHFCNFLLCGACNPPPANMSRSRSRSRSSSSGCMPGSGCMRRFCNWLWCGCCCAPRQAAPQSIPLQPVNIRPGPSPSYPAPAAQRDDPRPPRSKGKSKALPPQMQRELEREPLPPQPKRRKYPIDSPQTSDSEPRESRKKKGKRQGPMTSMEEFEDMLRIPSADSALRWT